MLKYNYIDIDFNNVEGFCKLSPMQQKLFIETYKIHNSIVGTDYKEGWRPIKVRWVENKENNKYSYLRVDFKNGDWLHYTQNKDWY